jgi:sulfotransferase famil protein
MPYSAKKCAVFIWIPKTAGTSLAHALRDEGVFARDGRKGLWGRIPEEERKGRKAANWQHISAQHVRDEIGPDAWGKSFKFTIIRNTYDRLVSFYEYSKASRTDPGSVQHGLPPVGTFQEWVEAQKPLSQLHYITDESGAFMVDFIGRHEHLDSDVATICGKLGMQPVRLENLRTSQRRDYQSYFSPEIRRIVENLYGEEIERLKYEF